LGFEVTGERLGAVLEDANEGDLVHGSEIGLGRKCRREEYMIDDEEKRGHGKIL